MAINVNDVYQTVLLILNKEQRGYMTPYEFNNIATQVQLEIFERYFEDLNQQVRIPQSDVDYADRVFAIEEKLESFRTTAYPTYSAGAFEIPTDLYKLGNVTFRNYNVITAPSPDEIVYDNKYVELEKLTRHEFNLIRNSSLLEADYTYPQYLYENNTLKVLPSDITQTGSIEIDYIKKPADVVWAYEIGSVDQLTFVPTGASGPTIPTTGTVDFELDKSEQTEVVINILFYAGVVLRDPQIIQVAAQKAQQEEANEKS